MIILTPGETRLIHNMEIAISLVAFWLIFFVVVFLAYTGFTDQYKAARNWKMLLFVAGVLSFIFHFKF